MHRQLDAHIHCLALTKPKLTLVDVDLAKILGPASAQLLAKNIGPIYCWSSVSHTSPATRAGVQEVVSPKPSAASVRAVLTGEGLGIDSLGPDSDGMILFTSGTTSMPKGVLSDQRAALVHFISGLAMGVRMALRAGAPLEMAMDLTKPPEVQSVMLLAVPLFHVTGCLGWMMRAMAFGMRMVFMRRWSVKDAIDIIVKEKCTVIGGVPSIAVAVLQSPLLPEDHVIENVTYGGAPPAQRLGDDIVKRWPMSMPTHAYGMTETNGLHTGFTGPDYLANVSFLGLFLSSDADHTQPEAVGPAVPICSIRIVDQETKEVLGPNQIGIVQCKGPNIMKEYVDNPKATAETLTADGWLDTGDMAMIGDNGFLYIRDRAKDVIIRGGENIASAEVENAVAMDDRIAEVAAVAVPCARLGERVGIAVSLAPGASATSHDILKTVEPRLRHPARPAIVLVLDLLPRNANGKIVKSDVKKIVHAEWAKIGGEHEAPAPRAKL